MVEFSVVVAAFNAEDTIAAAVASALDQTRPPLEVVVCDDGSTDATAAVLDGFGDRIRLVRQANGGEAAAKNRAIAEAAGEFVVVLDADDRFAPGRLEAMAALLDADPGLDVVTTDAWLEVDGVLARRVYDGSHRFAFDGQRAEILRRNFVFGLAAIRRSRVLAVGGYDESIPVTTDWDLWIRLVLSGSRIGLVPEPLAVYRMLPTSLSADRVRLLAGRIETLRKTLRDPRLTADERDAVAATLAAQTRELELAEARAALLAGPAAEARSRAKRVAANAAQSPLTRAKAALAWASPPLARRLLLRPAAAERARHASRLGGAAGRASGGGPARR